MSSPAALRRQGLVRRAAPFVVAAAIAFLVPLVTRPPAFVSQAEELRLLAAAAGLAVATGLAAWFTPWERLPGWVAVAVPLAYLAVVALLREAGGGSVSGYGIVALLPVVWVALYGSRGQLAATLAGVALMFVVPIVAIGEPGYPESDWRRAILSVAMAAVVGLAITQLVGQVRGALARERRSEAGLQAVVRSAADGIVAFDLEGRVILFNPAAAAMLGRPAEELIGEHAPLAAALRTGGEASAGDECFRRADGSEFPVEYQVTPLVASGERTGSLLVFRDVTERRAVEQLKDQFVATVSHELRTPLTSIRGSLGLLAGGVAGELPADAKAMVAIAESNSERLMRLVDDILDIERIDAGGMRLEPRAVRTAAVAAAATESVRGLAERRGVRIDAEGDDHELRADFDRLVQVLTNVLGNAVKFSPEGGVVRVTTSRGDSEITFAVSDSGRGIPGDKLEAVFERFQQVDASDARDRGGTGLGLAISRSIVEQHGGRIWADSELGRGATFYVSLPA